MLNELSTRDDDHRYVEASQAAALPDGPEPAGLREAIDEIMVVNEVLYPQMPQLIVQYAGQLTMSGAEAFDQIEPTLKGLGVHGYFSVDEETDQHRVSILSGRFEPKPRPVWPNAVLLALTILSLLLTGALIQAGTDDREVTSLTDVRLYEGWPYALSLLLILGAHELGHYFAARYHKVKVTLPYFIPMPISFFGTLGAFIQLREPLRNRKVLFDVGISGPLAGLVFAIPILFIGLATSDVLETPEDEAFLREGNSLAYAASKLVVFGRFLPDDDTNEDVFINQLAQAGWTGLFITGLNLIPLGQLDGGHVLYTLLGPRASRLFWPIIGVFAVLSYWNSAWLLWTILLFFLGRFYARPLEDITPLDNRRRILGYIALIILVLVFVPNPLQAVDA